MLWAMMYLTGLPRGVIELSGEDRVGFLQGLVSNDVAACAPGRAVWAALLTPQGKYLADFFLFSDGARLLIDCEAGQAEDLVRRLSRYRLRAKVALRDASAEWQVYAAWGDALELPESVIAAPDPRLPEAGWRILSPIPLPATATAEDWDAHRLALGLPDGSRDMVVEKTVLLEAGFDELGGVSWSKGCYLGQELTARTKYRGLLKRRLVPVEISGPAPAPGTPILRDGMEAGEMRSSHGTQGLVQLRLDALGGKLDCGGAVLTPRPPAWMRLSDG